MEDQIVGRVDADNDGAINDLRLKASTGDLQRIERRGTRRIKREGWPGQAERLSDQMRRQRRIERCERVSRTLPCPMACGIVRMPSAWIGEVRDEDTCPALADLGLARIGPRLQCGMKGPGTNRVDLGSNP